MLEIRAHVETIGGEERGDLLEVEDKVVDEHAAHLCARERVEGFVTAKLYHF